MKFFILYFFGLVLLIGHAHASDLIEYHMAMPPSPDGAKRVALTFDACMGKTDDRILNALVDHNIKATIFVTARWLKYNTRAIAILKAHPELFEIENHGAQHLPTVDQPMDVYGLKAAGSPDAVIAEVEDGAAAVEANFGHWPQWYRGAGAIYTASAMALVKTLDFRLGGFSMSGDGGASWSAFRAEKTIAAARDGDVIIAHINQPHRVSGQGVVDGILSLHNAGFSFVTLDEGFSKSGHLPLQSHPVMPGHI